MIHITNLVQIAATTLLLFLTTTSSTCTCSTCNTCNTLNTRSTCTSITTRINTTPTHHQQQHHHHMAFLLGARDRHFRNNIDSLNDENKIAITTTRLNSSNSNSDDYRSIGEVVGGLHGGKYQFNDNSSNDYNYDYAGYASQSSCNNNQDDERSSPKEIPNWALQMSMPMPMPMPISSAYSSSSALRNPEIINVPSNSNPMDGMIYSASVEIQNQERTWEEFHAKLVMKLPNGEFIEIDNGANSSSASCGSSSIDSEATRITRPQLPITLQPRSGSLAPRGGASNACDASNPYSDRVQIRVIQGQFTAIEIESSFQDGEEIWLVVGTEEEKWYYLLKLER